jgi:hypothetical protein
MLKTMAAPLENMCAGIRDVFESDRILVDD